jgi:alanyl-tRNA synthetase
MSTPVISVADIRKTFLDFFASKVIPWWASSPLVPGNDPTLMFTNSGMVQFKDVFWAKTKEVMCVQRLFKPAFVRAVSTTIWKNVGYTARHHTFLKCWAIGALVIISNETV